MHMNNNHHRPRAVCPAREHKGYKGPQSLSQEHVCSLAFIILMGDSGVEPPVKMLCIYSPASVIPRGIRRAKPPVGVGVYTNGLGCGESVGLVAVGLCPSFYSCPC